MLSSCSMKAYGCTFEYFCVAVLNCKIIHLLICFKCNSNENLARYVWPLIRCIWPYVQIERWSNVSAYRPDALDLAACIILYKKFCYVLKLYIEIYIKVTLWICYLDSVSKIQAFIVILKTLIAQIHLPNKFCQMHLILRQMNLAKGQIHLIETL